MKPSWIDRKFWLGLVCSIVLLFLALRQVNWGRTAATLVQADWRLLLVGACAQTTTYVLFAFRWRLLVYRNDQIARREIFSYMMIGYLLNTVLPMRLGEVQRASLLGKRHGMSFSAAFGSVVLDRTFDIASLLTLGFAVSLLMDVPPLVHTALVTFAVATLSVFVGLLIVTNRETQQSLLVFIPQRLAANRFSRRLEGMIKGFTEGLSVLRDRSQLGFAWCLSVLAWLVAGAGAAAFVAAFHFHVPWYAGFFLLVVTNLGAAIPSSPGSIGVYHFLAVLAISVWVSDKGAALGYAIATHGIYTMLIIIIGSLCLTWQGLNSIGLPTPAIKLEDCP
jgi:glycosyltransferase 2 family protein